MPVGPIHRDDASAQFFDASARGEMSIRRCPRCRHAWSPHLLTCAECGALELDWVTATGRARLVSWTVVHGRPAGDAPATRTVVGLVELEEGPWFDAELVDVDEAALTEGTALVAAFHRPAGSEALPVFRPA